MKGRPRDPKRAKRRTGHRRKPDEAPRLSIVPASVLPAGLEPPEDLPEAMAATWTRVVDLLVSGGMPLRGADALAVEGLVRQYHRMKEAGRLVDQYGVVMRTEAGTIVTSPLVRAERDATVAFLRIAEQFGMTVGSRMRLGLMVMAGKTMSQTLQEDLEG